MMLFVTLLFTGFMSVKTTRLLCPKLYTDSCVIEIPARIIFGMAILVCGMNVLLHFIPGLSASWALLVGILIATLIVFRIHFVDLVNKKGFIWVIIAISLVIFGLRLLPLLKLGVLVPFEGTGNHDDIFYLFTADWLLEHSLLQQYPADPSFPFYSSVLTNITILPRIGAESLLIFISAICGMTVLQVYPVLFALASVLFVFSVALAFVDDPKADLLSFVTVLVVSSLSPVALFIFENNNFATLFGLIFLSGFYWYLQHVLFHSDSKGDVIASGIFLGALVATYPELLSVAIPAMFFMLLLALKRDSTRWIYYLKKIIQGVMVSLVVAPYAVVEAIKVLATITSAVQVESSICGSLCTSLSSMSFVLTIFTFITWHKTGFFANAGIGLASAVFLATMLLAPRKLLWNSAGLLMGCMIILAMCLVKNYEYGLMKAIEFFTLPLSALLSGSVVSLARTWRGRGALTQEYSLNTSITDKSEMGMNYKKISSKNKLGMLIKQTLILLVVTFLCVDFCILSTKYYRVAINKHITQDLLGLQRLSQLLKPNDVLFVDQDLGLYPFLASRWIAYLLRDIPLVFAPELHGGGYIYGLETNFAKRFAEKKYVLRAHHVDVINSKRVVFRNASYEVVYSID